MVTATDVRVRREPVRDTIRRLETLVKRYERRYECSSRGMANAIKNGLARETAEISTWLTNYRVLTNLKRRPPNGHMTGTRTTTT